MTAIFAAPFSRGMARTAAQPMSKDSGAAAPEPYTMNLVDNANTRTLAHTGSLGLADSRLLSFSMWLYFDDVTGTQRLFDATTAKFRIIKSTATNYLSVTLNDGTVNKVITVNHSTVANGLNHISMFVDLDGYGDFEGDGSLYATVNGSGQNYTLGQIADPLSTIALSTHTAVYLLGSATATNPFKGKLGDTIFNNTTIAESALTYNAGVPIDPSGITAAINIHGQNAASFAAGTANTNGAGGAFAQAGSGSWTDA